MQTRPIEDLKPDPVNPRTISDNALAGLSSSMKSFGDLSGIVFNWPNQQLVAGHQRLKGLRAAGAGSWTVEREPVPDGPEGVGFVIDPRTGQRFNVRLVWWDATTQRIANLVANNPHIAGEFTAEAIEQIREVEDDARAEGLRLDALAEALERELDREPEPPQGGNGDPDAVPEAPPEPITKLGDLWVLGEHRLLCGDTTDPRLVERLVAGRKLVLLSADPPYGMGKEADGVQNDNLYDEKLDAFQMRWWKAWTASALSDTGSAYIWGNAPDLWRLWWKGGLANEPQLMVRNEIVWDKGSGFGMRSDWAHSFPPATERCLFLMRGQQFLGNQNKEDFWEGYEPLRAWLESERDRAGWKNPDVNRITGTQMAGHWFSRSQFQPISREHYDKLAAAAAGRAFAETYDELFDRLFVEVREGGNRHRRDLTARLRESRTFFDNTHDAMTDVWDFPRVHGEERYGHATPKPVAMIERIIKSSSSPGDAIGAPFGGTGPEFIAAERLGRACVGMEITPAYCDIIVARWEAFTGKRAHRETPV